MKVILFGGNSLDNKIWIEKIETAMKVAGIDADTHVYRHWREGGDLLAAESEIESAAAKLPSDGNYCFFAKSAGILLCLRGMYEKKFFPRKCVFVGLPIAWALERGFDLGRWIHDFSLPMLCIQHTDDPAASAEAVRNFLQENNVANYSCIDLPGASHYYPEIQELVRRTIEFIHDDLPDAVA